MKMHNVSDTRRAPIHLRDKIRAELDRMLDLDVIRPVVEPTDWVSSIAYVQKVDGSLRICLDPKDLNDALKRGQHHINSQDQLFSANLMPSQVIGLFS